MGRTPSPSKSAANRIENTGSRQLAMIVFLSALPDQAHVAGMRHDHFVAQTTQ